MPIQITLTGAQNDTEYIARVMAVNQRSQPNTRLAGSVAQATPKAQILVEDLPMGSVVNITEGDGVHKYTKGATRWLRDEIYFAGGTVTWANRGTPLANWLTGIPAAAKALIAGVLSPTYADITNPPFNTDATRAKGQYYWTNGTNSSYAYCISSTGGLTQAPQNNLGNKYYVLPSIAFSSGVYVDAIANPDGSYNLILN